MHENEISGKVIDCCYKIHKNLGPGLFESVYEEVLCFELNRCGFRHDRQKAITVNYENVTLELGFRPDLIIEDKVIVEIKSVETIAPVHKKQLLTYLKLTNLKLGLLINFNVNLIKEGIIRIVNKL